MNHQALCAAVALSLCAASAFGNTIIYHVTADTTGAGNGSGFIEFQLNSGGLPAEAVSATIANFTGGTLDPANASNFSSTGTFPLPGALMLNATSSTDYFEAIAFASSIAFDLTLSGPGINLAGMATSQSGTNFILDFLDAGQSNFLFTNDPNGVAGSVVIDPSGTVSTVTNPNPSGGPSVVTFGPLLNTPEPSSFLLCVSGLVLAGATAARARRRRTARVRRKLDRCASFRVL